MSVIVANAKTLVAYYSYTNNVHTIVSDLLTQIDADVIRIEPAEKGLDYTANNYAIGSRLIQAIRDNPNDAASYPAIDPVDVNIADYDMVVIATPLWWSNMAAPMQTFLFKYGEQMAGKHIALIVSSASSGISSVVADAKRLVPGGTFVEPNLWIRSSQTSNCHSLTMQWLNDIHYSDIASSISNTTTMPTANRIALSSDGVEVSGDFDLLTIYNDNGQKVLQTSLASTPFPFQGGCYIAQLKCGKNIYTTKLLQ